MIQPIKILMLCVSSLLLTGCATQAKHKSDPLEGLNRGIYAINRTVDKLAIKPIAKVYDAVIPKPVKKGVHNFFENLNDIPTIANGVLQGRFPQAISDSTRFLVNSTLGIGGIFDVADHWGLQKHKADFGQTLALWGYRDSTYLVLPFFGPSTVRDGVGRVATYYMSVWPYIKKVKVRNIMFASYVIDTRASLLGNEAIMEEAASGDEYAWVRDAYLRHRQYEIDGETSEANDERLLGPPS